MGNTTETPRMRGWSDADTVVSVIAPVLAAICSVVLVAIAVIKCSRSCRNRPSPSSAGREDPEAQPLTKPGEIPCDQGGGGLCMEVCRTRRQETDGKSQEFKIRLIIPRDGMDSESVYLARIAIDRLFGNVVYEKRKKGVGDPCRDEVDAKVGDNQVVCFSRAHSYPDFEKSRSGEVSGIGDIFLQGENEEVPLPKPKRAHSCLDLRYIGLLGRCLKIENQSH